MFNKVQLGSKWSSQLFHEMNSLAEYEGPPEGKMAHLATDPTIASLERTFVTSSRQDRRYFGTRKQC